MQVQTTLPWSRFFETLSFIGHRFVDISENPDVVIFMNGHPKLLRKVRAKNKGIICFLIMWESEVTRPLDYKKKNLMHYDYIFSPSHLWIRGKNVEYFHWPSNIQSRDILLENKDKSRKNQIVMVAANKFSMMPQELYSLRRRYLRKSGDIIDVYGTGWNSLLHVMTSNVKAIITYFKAHKIGIPSLDWLLFTQPKNYYGVAVDKNILKNYRYALVLENQGNYVSEKIFDCLVYGCIPLYAGPELEDFGIPGGVALQLGIQRRFVNDLKRIIDENESSLETIRQKGKEFIESSKAKKFDNCLVLEGLANRIGLLISTELKK